jgi:hypothetical protein
METKICSNCNSEKSTTEYHKSGMTHGDGLRGECKPCCNAKKREKKRTNMANPLFREEHNRKGRDLYHRDKSFQQKSSAKWYQDNREVVKEKHKNYRENNKEKEYIRHRVYYEQHKLELSIRHRLYFVFKTGRRCEELLSCEYKFLKKWFDYHFSIDTNLNYYNHGGVWHIDHVIPCAAFDLKNENHIKRCFHWSNLMPLLAEKNLSKNKKICHISIDEQNRRLRKFCTDEKIDIVQISLNFEQDISIAGTSLELSTTTFEEATLQNTQGNDLGHSNNVKDWKIRIGEHFDLSKYYTTEAR